ncbi:putative signal peptide protein [Puccinia sorghi]|uniref:Putative signal peptide protein n=1 Tax=Puccinia sorghi TaxID=27349 RepID=A0A0L6UQD8_9BASI|nr:putative signal peptide protein [Puccinia sorghi]
MRCLRLLTALQLVAAASYATALPTYDSSEMVPVCPKSTGLINISFGNTVSEGCLESTQGGRTTQQISLQDVAALLSALF